MAVTGPTGDIGRSLVRSLDRSDQVGQIVAMARGPFDPAAAGLDKTEYRRGDVLDRVAVDELVAGADVVVHLAFLIVGDHEQTERINLEGSRTVFEAAVAAGAKRLVYASSTQKAALEEVLTQATEASVTAAYVFRLCTVAGDDALALIKNIPYVQLAELARRYQNPLTAIVLDAARRFPTLKPVLPDPGVPFQLVHHDDVASALRAAVQGRGAPGPYNLAGPGEVTVSDLATELGWHSFQVSETALDSLAEVIARLPLAPAQAQWIESIRQPVLMTTEKARRELGWEPRHDALHTLRETVEAAREQGLLAISLRPR